MNSKIDLKKSESENELQYVWRICLAKDSGVLDATWEDVADILNKELIDDDCKYLNESVYRKKFQQAKAFYENVFSKMRSDEYQDQITSHRRELQKERYKLQTEKLEYNRWLREDARDELFEQKVCEAIEKYAPKSQPPVRIENSHGKRAGILCLADCHFGKEFKIYGLFNEVINEYSPEIFYERMTQVYSEVIDLIEKEGLTELHVYNLGDSIDGFLRHSQLWSLRYGAIDSAVIYGNYMGDWLRSLSEHVCVVYHQSDGNHDEMRLLDGRKGQHLNESVGKIIKNCIAIKNESNPNFSLVENKTGLIFDTVCGFNILGIHGEVKDLRRSIMEFENIYDTKISYLIAGHKHHGEFSECGVRKGCIGVGSIIGSDDFSMSIRQAADASATFLIFEQGKGKVDEHTIVLN